MLKIHFLLRSILKKLCFSIFLWKPWYIFSRFLINKEFKRTEFIIKQFVYDILNCIFSPASFSGTDDVVQTPVPASIRSSMSLDSFEGLKQTHLQLTSTLVKKGHIEQRQVTGPTVLVSQNCVQVKAKRVKKRCLHIDPYIKILTIVSFHIHVVQSWPGKERKIWI